MSVRNAMGLFLSYRRTGSYGEQLNAKIESIGPWDTRVMNPVAIPTFQLDNWHMKPLHVVKVDGKDMPKVNGSLLQGRTKKRKLTASAESDIQNDIKRLRTSTWKMYRFLVAGMTSWRASRAVNTKLYFSSLTMLSS